MGRMKRTLGTAATIVLLTSACATLSSSPAGPVVRVDHRNDEFGSYFWRYFPATIAVHPGQTVTFQQEWTGEPHTVTFGTLVDEAMRSVDALSKQLDEQYGAPIRPPTRSRPCRSGTRRH